MGSIRNNTRNGVSGLATANTGITSIPANKLRQSLWIRPEGQVYFGFGTTVTQGTAQVALSATTGVALVPNAIEKFEGHVGPIYLVAGSAVVYKYAEFYE